jgi:hypothetical protein
MNTQKAGSAPQGPPRKALDEVATLLSPFVGETPQVADCCRNTLKIGGYQRISHNGP